MRWSRRARPRYGHRPEPPRHPHLDGVRAWPGRAQPVAVGVVEGEPSPARERVGRLDHRATGGLHDGDGPLEVVGVEQHQHAARAGGAANGEAADLTLAVGPTDAGVRGAVVVEAPAEGRGVERLGPIEVGHADLDVVDRVVDVGLLLVAHSASPAVVGGSVGPRRPVRRPVRRRRRRPRAGSANGRVA